MCSGAWYVLEFVRCALKKLQAEIDQGKGGNELDMKKQQFNYTDIQ